MPRAYEEKGACKSQNEEKGAYKNQKERENGPTKIKIKAIDPQNFFAPQNILLLPRAYESLNPGLNFMIITIRQSYLSK